jgi:hypothetical protein
MLLFMVEWDSSSLRVLLHSGILIVFHRTEYLRMECGGAGVHQTERTEFDAI